MDERTNDLAATPEEVHKAAGLPDDDLARYGAPEIWDGPPSAPPAQAPTPAADVAGEDDDDDAPTEWVPTRFERFIHAIPESRWNLYQLLAGTAIGLFALAALFWGGEGLSPMMIATLVLTLFLPSLLETRGRRKLGRIRLVMIVVLAVGLVAMAIRLGLTQGWDFFKAKD